MTEALTGFGLDRARLMLLADWLAVCVAVSLPWSTSATAISIVVWLLVLLPTLDIAAIRREVETAAGGLPVLLWVFAAVGMLWANVSWAERIEGLGGIPSAAGHPVAAGAIPAVGARGLGSLWLSRVDGRFAAAVLGTGIDAGLDWRGKGIGIPVKDYIFQSTIFLVCAFALFGRACEDGRKRNWRMVFGSLQSLPSSLSTSPSSPPVARFSSSRLY